MKKVLTNIRTSELSTLAYYLVSLFKKAAELSEDAFLKSVFEEMAALYERITTALKKTKVSTSLEEADSVRDTAVRELGNLLSGYASFPLAEKRAAAQTVLDVFNKYGKKIAHANYSEESAYIESLLIDVAQEPAASAVKALDGVTELIAALRTAETAFKASHEEFAHVSAQNGQKDSAYLLKKPLLSLINDKLVVYLNTMQMVSSEKYAPFAQMVEQEIAKQNDSIIQRTKKAAAEKK